MDQRDIIIIALTPGSPFNTNNKVWRSTRTLAAFCDCEVPEVMSLLAGDLGHLVTFKVPAKSKGILVALRENVPAPEEQENPPPQQVVVAGGPVMNAPLNTETEDFGAEWEDGGDDDDPF